VSGGLCAERVAAAVTGQDQRAATSTSTEERDRA
jgi:hypothetical protein